MSGQKTLVCFGDSLTEGVIGASYVDLLRPCLPHTRIINAGINGDTILNLLRRVERDVVAHQPDVVTVLVGLNDFATAYGYRSGQPYYKLGKRVLVKVTPRRFAHAYRMLLTTLRHQTAAQVVLCTLTAIGEQPDDAVNVYLDAYSHVVRALAYQEGLACVDLRQAFKAAIQADPRPGPSYRIWMPVLDGAAVKWRGQSYAALAERRGYRLLCDGVHLAAVGAQLVADTILPVIQPLLAIAPATRASPPAPPADPPDSALVVSRNDSPSMVQ